MLRQRPTPRTVRPVNFKPLFQSTPRTMQFQEQPEPLHDMLPPLTPGVITIDSSCSESPTRGPSPAETVQAQNDQRPLSTEPVLHASKQKKRTVRPVTIPETPRFARVTKCWASRMMPTPKPSSPKKKNLRLSDEDRQAVWKRLWGERAPAAESS